MGKLIVVVGNSGVGKTSLTKALREAGNFASGMEEHATRPFHDGFKKNASLALANQIDFLLLRGEQERAIRNASHTGIQDGGLEMDFYVFTRLFRQKGLLSMLEYQLCERLYAQIRASQPPPEGILWLIAPVEVVAKRFAKRSRPLEITEHSDLETIETLLQDWLDRLDKRRILSIDASRDDPSYQDCLGEALKFIASR